MMPGTDGPALCRLIREDKSDDYTYFIILTTLEDTTSDRLAYIRAQLSDDYASLFGGAPDGGAPARATDRSARRD